MEEQILISREIVEGHLIETYEVDNTVGFSVVISEVSDPEFDSESKTVPVWRIN